MIGTIIVAVLWLIAGITVFVLLGEVIGAGIRIAFLRREYHENRETMTVRWTVKEVKP